MPLRLSSATSRGTSARSFGPVAGVHPDRRQPVRRLARPHRVGDEPGQGAGRNVVDAVEVEVLEHVEGHALAGMPKRPLTMRARRMAQPALAWRRSLEVARPSASRYLATVRRATFTPSPDRTSASCASLKGLPGLLLRDQLADARADRNRRDVLAARARRRGSRRRTGTRRCRAACACTCWWSPATPWTRAARRPPRRRAGSSVAWPPRPSRGTPPVAARWCVRP